MKHSNQLRKCFLDCGFYPRWSLLFGSFLFILWSFLFIFCSEELDSRFDLWPNVECWLTPLQYLWSPRLWLGQEGMNTVVSKSLSAPQLTQKTVLLSPPFCLVYLLRLKLLVLTLMNEPIAIISLFCSGMLLNNGIFYIQCPRRNITHLFITFLQHSSVK